MISIRHVTKRFGRTAAVNDVSLDIEPGDAVALWGTNGAGKTTLIRCVLGLFRFQGQIRVDDFDVARQGKLARARIGYVPQELGFYDDLGVAEAVALFARLKGVRSVYTPDILGRVGLTGHEHKRIRELSGGMKQRLALAIALLGDPPVLVLDEVTASLDACGREEFVSLLSGLARGGRSLLFASHRIEEVTALAQRVITLDKGKVTAEIPAREFIPHLGLQATLHLRIASGAREQAARLLREGGFDPQRNGIGLIVAVPTAQKAAPFRILSEGRIAVEDFELLAHTDSHTDSHAAEHTP
ncbi:MAG: ABC transporter ATP-binding protein [Phycisphaerales bacterium]|nr:ABC transporter ATP-binding protein [Phycisphaerales bacterium]